MFFILVWTFKRKIYCVMLSGRYAVNVLKSKPYFEKNLHALGNDFRVVNEHPPLIIMELPKLVNVYVAAT